MISSDKLTAVKQLSQNVEERPTKLDPSFINLFSKLVADSKSSRTSYADALDLMNSKKWYKKSFDYYNNLITPTIDGMLGGLAYVHEGETAWTRKYLAKQRDSNLLGNNKTREELRVLDIGAGIGRVTRYSLSEIFGKSDCLEACKPYLLETFKNFASESESAANKRICLGIQDIKKITSIETAKELFDAHLVFPTEERENQKLLEDEYCYDAVFIQWVVGYATDDDFILGLKALKNVLTRDGIIFLKENYCYQGTFYIDDTDFNILRPLEVFHEIFKRAGYIVIDERDPETWPHELYPIKMFTIIPEEGLQYNEAARNIVENKKKTASCTNKKQTPPNLTRPLIKKKISKK